MPIRARRFKRKILADTLPEGVYESIVKETDELLERRLSKANEVVGIEQTNFNPFLLLITAPVYNIFSPYEVAERLQLGSAFHGDDTSFGRFAEEKILPLFGATLPHQKSKSDRLLAAIWEPVDRSMTIEGHTYLISLKAGPWTMNQSHANGMIEKFPEIHRTTNARCMIGITYGRYADLNNKPALVQNGLNDPEWFDYLVGRDFWEFVSGVRNVHVHIFNAIRDAQAIFASRHKDETFHERLIHNRLQIASSLRKKFDLTKEDDFWETLFNGAFEANTEETLEPPSAPAAQSLTAIAAAYQDAASETSPAQQPLSTNILEVVEQLIALDPEQWELGTGDIPSIPHGANSDDRKLATIGPTQQIPRDSGNRIVATLNGLQDDTLAYVVAIMLYGRGHGAHRFEDELRDAREFLQNEGRERVIRYTSGKPLARYLNAGLRRIGAKE